MDLERIKIGKLLSGRGDGSLERERSIAYVVSSILDEWMDGWMT